MSDPGQQSIVVAQPLRIVPVTGRRLLQRFIRLPWSLYAGDPLWVPPLLLERREHLAPGNPHFAHIRWQGWLACRGDRPVGRISAQVDRLHLETHRDATGFFGMLEAEDDPEVFQALLHTAETWLREQGLVRVRGPFDLSINEQSGLLIEGFDTPPAVMMGHHPPYYRPRLEEQGYGKAKDLLAYWSSTAFSEPSAMQQVTRRTLEKVRIRPLNRRRVGAELELLRDIFNDAWVNNWGFIPFTAAEFAHIGRDLLRLTDPDFIQIAEVQGEPAAMIVLLPNLNEILRDLNGRLFPTGWIKLLWRLWRTYPQTARILLMGVRRHYQHQMLGAVLAFLIIDALRAPAARRGIRGVELSWIFEDNQRMRHIIESAGAQVYKRYRIFEKDLS